MAWNTPGTATAGEVLTAAFWNEQVRDNMTELAPLFTTFTSWTPAVAQSGARTSTNRGSRYIKIGRLVIAWCHVDTIQAGSAGNVLSCSLPIEWSVDHLTAGEACIGVGHYFTNATNTHYVLSVMSNDTYPDSTRKTVFFRSNGATNVFGVNPSVATGTSDVFSFLVAYMTD